jgi:hypothetical protein
MTYKLIDRFFSRLWRRNKRYSEHELRWLARKRGLAVRLKGDYLEIVHPANKQVMAHFKGSGDYVPMTPFGKV